MAAIGLVCGIAGMLGLGRLIASMLVGVQPLDPLTLMGVSLVVAVAAVAALVIPARRAMSVDPMEAMRNS